MSTPSIVIESVSVTIRDPATNQSIEFRGNLGSPLSPGPARERSAPSEAAAAQAVPRARPTSSRERTTDPKPEKKSADRTREPTKAEAPKTKKNVGPRKQPELKWTPVVDASYHGFAAASGSGSFRVLRRRGTQWVLFFVWRNGQWKVLGCFLDVERAQARAERDHRKRMPEKYEINAEVLAQACPMPEGVKEEDIEPSVAAPEPKVASRAAEATPKASEPKPASAEKPEAEQDKELLGSFQAELESVLDEEDD